ncbi:MAG: hypothetical protein ACKVW3_17150 [Phycisphaerales bacterium]
MNRSLLALAAALTCFLTLAAIGTDQPDVLAGPIAALLALARSGSLAAAYLLGGIGLGLPLIRFLNPSRHPAAIAASLGIAIILSLSHALGCLGLLSGTLGQILASIPVALGLVLLGLHLSRRGHQALPRLSPWLLLALPPVAVMLVAAASPPGWLWASEAGGYDALSYHLQLPREWLAFGRIQPLPHNVYSYLPSYVESAYVHLAALAGSGRPGGLLAGDGTALLACQFLSAWFAILAAWLVAQLASSIRPHSGIWAAIALLAVPWVVVTGSLAYNETAVLALGAGALLAASDSTLRRRALVAGLLVGVACGCKPTALFLLTPGVAVLLIASAPRQIATSLAFAALAGALAIAPWLLRNALHGGNPVFPFAAAWFGNAHWSPEQLSRYASAHHFRGTVLDRLRLLVLPDPSDPAGPRHRGLLHPQWSIFFPLAAVAWFVLSRRANDLRTRRLASLLGFGMALGLVAWLFFTHIQSRFLLPLAVPAAVLIGLAATTVTRPAIPAVLLAVLSIASVWNFLMQPGGAESDRTGTPNALLVPGPSTLTGQHARAALAAASPQDRDEFLANCPIPAFINLVTPPNVGVLLVGTATPLYYTGRIMYATTWDESPLARAIRKHPGNPRAWAADLAALGVGIIVIDESELARLHASGWLDPALTPEAILAFLQGHARPVRAEGAVGVFELVPLSPQPSAAPPSSQPPAPTQPIVPQEPAR